MSDCVFCKIATKQERAHIIWEDDEHLAFLTRWPNTEGFSVVIPKQHYPSYAFNLDDAVLCGLTKAAKCVGLLLDSKLDQVGRTGLIYEGFGVDHVHAKLFPMHGTVQQEWKPISSPETKFFKQYEGYISSHEGPEVDDQQLASLAERLQE